MNTQTKLDCQLVRALREGSSALPSDLRQLRSYLRLIESLLLEKADELEPSWEQACASAAEIATLQALEASVVERAIAVRADNLDALRTKLAIWRTLESDAEDGERCQRDRLVLSVEADLERLSCRVAR